MAILISGSSGFLGKKLINVLKKDFEKKIYIVSNKKKNTKNFININNVENLKKFKSLKNRIDIVIHLATKYENTNTTKTEIYDVNYLYSLKVYKFAKEINSKYFLNISTILNDQINYYSYTKNLFKKMISNKKGMKVINCI